jgi:uncharacterized protein
MPAAVAVLHLRRNKLNSNAIWLAFALVLVIEGLLPFVSPTSWRRVFTQILQMQDGQIRFFGLVSIFLGLLLAWLT